MAVNPSLTFDDSGGPAPHTIQLAPGQDIRPASVFAEIDGSGAAASFLICLTIKAQDGTVVSRTCAPVTFAAGDSGVVTFAPFLGRESSAVVGGAGPTFTVANRSGANFWDDVWIVPAAGGAATQVTAATPDQFYDYPRLSPDGASIVYLWSTAVLTNELWIMNVDGSGQTALVAAQSVEPQWVDADTVLFQDTTKAFYTINRDGSGLTTVVAHANQFRGMPSPDGTKLAYLRSVAGVTQLWLVNIDGTGDTLLSTGLGAVTSGGGPVWRRDGSRIVFAKGVGLSSILPDGTGEQVELTPMPNGFYFNEGMASDRLMLTDTTVFANWKMGHEVFGVGYSQVAPALSVFRAVQRGVEYYWNGRIYTVEDGTVTGNPSYFLSVLPDGSDRQIHFTPDESGAPLFQNVFIR